jgi:hypothetical protein
MCGIIGFSGSFDTCALDAGAVSIAFSGEVRGFRELRGFMALVNQSDSQAKQYE